jgi:hypothetical protein
VQGLKFAVAPMEQAIQRHLQVDEVCLFSGLSKQGHEEVVVAIQTDRNIPRSQLESLASNFRRVKSPIFDSHSISASAEWHEKNQSKRIKKTGV